MTAIVISIVGSVFSGMTLFFLQAFFKKQGKKNEDKEKARQRENVLVLKSIDAIGKLTYANAIAIKDGRTNGELKDAIKDYHQVREDLYNFIIEESTKT